MGIWAESTCHKAVAGRPSEVADCGAWMAKLQVPERQQLVDPATDHATLSSSVGK